MSAPVGRHVTMEMTARLQSHVAAATTEQIEPKNVRTVDDISSIKLSVTGYRVRGQSGNVKEASEPRHRYHPKNLDSLCVSYLKHSFYCVQRPEADNEGRVYHCSPNKTRNNKLSCCFQRAQGPEETNEGQPQRFHFREFSIVLLRPCFTLSFTLETPNH